MKKIRGAINKQQQYILVAKLLYSFILLNLNIWMFHFNFFFYKCNVLLLNNSRRPHQVPLICTTNMKKRLLFARAHQNWTVEDWKNVAWSDESRFLLRH